MLSAGAHTDCHCGMLNVGMCKKEIMNMKQRERHCVYGVYIIEDFEHWETVSYI